MNDLARPALPTLADQPLEFTRLLYMLSQDMDNLTRHADMKAQIILAINAILTATVVGKPASFAEASTLQVLAFGCGLVTLMLMIASVYFSLRTVVPRNVAAHARARNLLFYADIARLPDQEYVAAFLCQSVPELRAQVLLQVHAKAGVAEAKFRSVRRAVGLLFAAVSVWLLGRILIALV